MQEAPCHTIQSQGWEEKVGTWALLATNVLALGFKILKFKPGPPGTFEGIFVKIGVLNVFSLTKTSKYLSIGVFIVLLPQNYKCLEAYLAILLYSFLFHTQPTN